MPFLSSRFSSLSDMLKPATNFFTLVFESPGTYLLEGELTEFLTMDIYAWGAGGGNSYGANGGGGAFVRLGGLIPPDGSTLEITVGSTGSPGGTAVGEYPGTNIYYTAQLTGRVEWSDFLRQYAVWDGNGDYTWKAYFPVTGLYDIDMSVDDYGIMYIDNTEVHRTGNTAPNITTTMTMTVNGAGGGAGGHDAGTPGRAGTAGSRVTGTFPMTMGVDTVEINVGTGGDGGNNTRGSSEQLVSYSYEVLTNTLLGAASLANATPTTGALSFTGWEGDGFWTVPLPWSVNFNNSTYGSAYIGTNSYLTFGAGSTRKTGTLNLDSIMISGENNSAQRIYYGTEGIAPNRTFRIRWEGTNIGEVATEEDYKTPGTYQWTCPPGVNRVAVVMVGGGGGAAQDESGGGGGGGLAWKNDIAVVPGQTYTVVVGAGGARSNYGQPGGKGGNSTAFGVTAFGGKGTGDPNPGFGGAGGGFSNADGGGVGGAGGDGNRRSIQDTGRNQGGGGAGGYTGNGGRGADFNTNNQTAGAGGGGGGGANGGPGEYGGGGGGGTGLFGLGANGAAGTPGSQTAGGGRGGSGGGDGGSNRDSNTGGDGGFPGGGAGADDGAGGRGGNGAVRIVYNFADTGVTRSFPSTNVGSILRRTGGTLGNPNMVWEVVFYENNRNRFDVQLGINARSGTGTTGIYGANNLKLSTFPTDKNLGLRYARIITRGRGATGGSGLVYTFFDLKDLPDVQRSTSLTYPSFLRDFGVWDSTNARATSFQRNATFTVPVTGGYRIRGACDSSGFVYIDNVEILILPVSGTQFSETVYLTAGSHTIRVVATNNSGIGSFACIIDKSFGGGNGGSAGIRGSSGEGGGGGAATVVRKNSTTFLAVAAGGGGGGGAGRTSAGQAATGLGQSNSWTGVGGFNKVGDGGGAGGGGGGARPGIGGDTPDGDAGAYSGEPGSSFAGNELSTANITLSSANNGGAIGAGSYARGLDGGRGSVIISYVTPTGAQLYEGGSVSRTGNVITHTFTTDGQFKPYSNAGYAFVWSRAANVAAGWRTIRINARNKINFAGIGARVRQANTAIQVWTTRDEKDPTVNGKSRGYVGGPSSFDTEGGQLTLTDTTANLWMSGKNAGYSNAGWTYSITREFYVSKAATYEINYMVSRGGGNVVSNVGISINGSMLGTSTNVSANANSFTTSLLEGFHNLSITGNAGVATGNVFAAIEIDYPSEIGVNLPIYSLRTGYISRNALRGGRGGPANRADGDNDGAFSGADGGGASSVRMNGMFLVVAGGGGGGGGSGDDRNLQAWQAGGGGRGEGDPVSGDGVGGAGASPGTNLTPGQGVSNGGGGGGGGGLTGGAGGTGAGRQVAAVGGQGGTSFVNRRVGTEWQVIAGGNHIPGGTTDVAYKSPFGYSANNGRVVVLFTRRPHIWQKIGGKWRRFDNISYKQNSSRSQRVWNFDNENFSTGSYTTGLSSQVRYYTEIPNMSAPLTAAIGSAVAIFGYNTLGTGAAAIRTIRSNTKINLSAFTHLWFQVNKGTSANWGENPDSGEAVYLQYSLDGNNWVNIDGTSPSSVSANVWTTRIATVPTAARISSGVFLRYYQTATYVAGVDIRDTWAMTSIVGLTNRTDAQAANRGFDLWKGISNVWVKVNGEWKRIYAQAITSTTPTPNRFG